MHINYYRELVIGFFLFVNVLFFSAPLYGASPCKLAFQMRPASSTISLNSTNTYTVTTKNSGGVQCKDVSVSLFYGKNETFVSSSPSPRASNYYWYIGNLGAGKTTSFSVVTKATSGTSIGSEGCASARIATDACASSTITVEQPAEVPGGEVATTTEAIFPSNSVSGATTTTAPARSHENGIWVWNFPREMNTATGDAQMKKLASYGFNTVYITIDDYLDIAAMPEGSAKIAAKAAYFAQLASFIQKANTLGIQVDAEGGANNWAMKPNRWKGFALIDAAKEYNSLYSSQKLRGFQYDVEPHTLADYETNKAVRLTEYVEFVDQSMARLQESDVAFSVVIPHFLDDGQAWTPAITYNGTKAYTFNHLLSVMDKKQGSTILLMSYRNFFNGANGTKEISQVEVQEAGGHPTKVVVGQETGNVQPALVTFYGSTKKTVFDMIGTINSSFATQSGFEGTATHYMDSFLEMK